MAIPFLQARYFTKGRGGVKPRLVVIHTVETPETVGRAVQVWRWFASKFSPQASAHYMTDAFGVEQSVLESDTAWAVGDFRLNQASISIELAGAASQTRAEWADAYSVAELAVVAKLAAQICKRWNIPVIRLAPAQILAGKSGFCGHIDITLAKQIRGGHTDPGSNFPWWTFLALVKAELNPTKPLAPISKPVPVVVPPMAPYVPKPVPHGALPEADLTL